MKYLVGKEPDTVAHGALSSQRDRVNINTWDMQHSLTWHLLVSLNTGYISNDRADSCVRYHIRFKANRTANTCFIVLAIHQLQ